MSSSPDPIVSSIEGGADSAAPDPEHLTVLADSVGLAMLIVLDRLPPAERLAFVLHDTFGLPFDEIAPIVDRTPTATRQLASRARRRVRGAGPTHRRTCRSPANARSSMPSSPHHEPATSRRSAHPRPQRRRPRRHSRRSRPVRGSDRGAWGGGVAAQATAFGQFAAGARHATVGGGAGAVVYSDGRPFAVAALTIRGDKIVEMDFILRPDRLRKLGLGVG